MIQIQFCKGSQQEEVNYAHSLYYILLWNNQVQKLFSSDVIFSSFLLFNVFPLGWHIWDKTRDAFTVKLQYT